MALAPALTTSCLPLDKNQLSRSKPMTYRTIRVRWSGSEEVYLLKSSVLPPEVYLRGFLSLNLVIRLRAFKWALMDLRKPSAVAASISFAFNFELTSYIGIIYRYVLPSCRCLKSLLAYPISLFCGAGRVCLFLREIDPDHIWAVWIGSVIFLLSHCLELLGLVQWILAASVVSACWRRVG